LQENLHYFWNLRCEVFMWSFNNVPGMEAELQSRSYFYCSLKLPSLESDRIQTYTVCMTCK